MCQEAASHPVAQVLITAQAHGAVDVLRAKVREAFQDIPEERMPLAVRLGLASNELVSDDGTNTELSPEEGTVEQVSREVLEKAWTCPGCVDTPRSTKVQ